MKMVPTMVPSAGCCFPEGVLESTTFTGAGRRAARTDYEAGGLRTILRRSRRCSTCSVSTRAWRDRKCSRGGGGPIPAQDLDGLWALLRAARVGLLDVKAIDHDTKDDLFCWLCLLGPCPSDVMRTSGTNKFYKSDDTNNVDLTSRGGDRSTHPVALPMAFESLESRTLITPFEMGCWTEGCCLPSRLSLPTPPPRHA